MQGFTPRRVLRQTPHLFSPAQLGAIMSYLMKPAEALRDIAEECTKSEIEQALSLCMGFADRVTRERVDAAEDPESLGRSITTKYFGLPN